MPNKLLILLEGPSQLEALRGEPLADQNGQQFIKFLHMAGIITGDCKIEFVCKHHIPEPRLKKDKLKRYYAKHTKKYKILKPEVEAHIPKLKELLNTYQPTAILACGELALQTLTGESSVSTYRGSILETLPDFYPTKVIPTYTPKEVQTMYEWHFPLICDAKRALYESRFDGIAMPQWNFIIRPLYDQVINTLTTLLEMAATPPDVNGAGRSYKIDGDGWLEFSPVRNDLINPSVQLTKTPTNKYLLSLDVETRQGFISCFGIAWSELDAICIPLLAVEYNPHYWNEWEELEIIRLLDLLFHHPHIEWSLQNENYDFQYFIRQWGIYPHHHFDIMQAHHTCWAGTKKALDFQSSLKLRFYRYWKDEGKEFHENIKTPDEEDKYWIYNCKDCVSTWELTFYSYIELERYGLMPAYLFQMEQQYVALKMMLRGTRANPEKRGQLAMEVQDAIAVRQNRLEYLISQPLNINSTKQMPEFFYVTMGQKRIINRYSGGTTTDDKALETIGLREPILRPIVQIIQELRSLNVFLGTFIKAPPSKDGRYRTSYKVAGPETFRWASAKDVFGEGLNLQNIPKGTES